MKTIRVVAFDCDGVMFDTLDANIQFYNDILDHFGKPPMTESQIEYSQMHTVQESIRFLFDGDGQLVGDADQYRKQRGYFPFIRMMKMEPDLKSLLARIRPLVKTAIATNRTDTMDRVLETFELTDDFDLVVSAMDVPRPKPHPDQLVRIMEHFGAAPHEVVFIGDSRLDQEAADASGVYFIAFRNPSLSAYRHIHSLNEVGNLIPCR